MEKGKLIIFSAPSGSGKSTIVSWLMEKHPELRLAFSISCTSRQPRGTERDGVEYFFLTPEAFRAKIERDEFLEYEESMRTASMAHSKHRWKHRRSAARTSSSTLT